MLNNSTINWGKIFSPKALMYTLLGVTSAVIALKGFMIPNHFLDGGVIGISILAHEIFHLNIGLVLLALNIPFLIIGYKKIGKTFAIQALLAAIILAIALNNVAVFEVTEDKVLTAIFGGLFLGLGIGLVIKGGSVIDGFEVIVHYTNKKSAFSTAEIFLATNSLIFLTAAFFLGKETAMYSILTYFTASQISNYIVDGFEEFTALTIISKNDDKVKEIIVKDFNKAISVYKGERGYLPSSFDVHTDCDIIVTVVTRLEIYKIQEAITSMDPNAFFFVQRIKEVKGGIVKDRGHH